MPPEIKLDELMAKQRAISEKAQSLVLEKDVEKIQAVTAELERDGRELDQLARDFEKQELAKAGPPPRGKLEVVLLPDQRERIKMATGVDMKSVFIADEAGVLSKAMPHTSPRDIEQIALAEARRLSATKNADTVMRAELERALDEIEKSGYGEVQTEVARLKADPNWMGGLLYKKKSD
jgi:hypothetical protein